MTKIPHGNRNRRLSAGRRLTQLLICALLLCAPAAAVPVSSFPVLAEAMWSEEYYRAVDTSGRLSDAESDSLDSGCLAFMEAWHMDFAMIAITSDRLSGRDLTEYARAYYNSCGFGYGPGRDGCLAVWNTDTDEMVIVPFGNAAGRIPADYLSYVSGSAPGYQERYGVFGGMYASMRMLDKYLEGHDDSEIPQQTIPYSSLRVGEGAQMPAWYPKDPANFPQYLDADAPRVVDTANLFSLEEKAAMEARLAEIRAELNRDIVVFTDVSTYGLSRRVYAADFYDFNGYGCGDEHEGVCLFICMDPSDRGGWTCCTGPVTRGLYTEEIANQIDDMLYDCLGSGLYYKGVSDWIENFRRLYISGSPYTPDWAMQDKQAFTRFHDDSAPRVSDDAGILAADEITALTQQAAAVSEAYGMDVVIHTAMHPGNMGRQEFSDDYYYYNGYGYGENFDGILLTIFKQPGHAPDTPCITASGKASARLTDTNRNRLAGRCLFRLQEGKYYTAAAEWLSQADHMLRTGRVPRSEASWEITIFLEMMAGLIVGAVFFLKAKATMAEPEAEDNADRYLVRKSLHIRKVANTLLHSSTTKAYSPAEEDRSSGGSSSGGSSSYSSSYSGSSGSTHSGSGRNF